MKKVLPLIARLALSAGVLCVSSPVIAESERSWWKTPDQRGVELLQSGDAETASEVFRDSRWRGISHYRSGNFAEAQKEFSSAADPDSLYNEGTAAARAGDYQTAVEKLEQLTESDPTHADASHNLGIVRQLLDQQQQSSNDSEQGEQDDSEQGDSADQSGDQSQSDQQEGDQPGEQQEGGESQQSDSGSQEQQTGDGGELSADEDEAKAAAEENQNQSAQTSPDQEQGRSEEEQGESEQAQSGNERSEDQSDSAANFTPTEPISESEQATEQWMRRIPDDPSQLLRNKIKLNHMIQHENVRDLEEPW